MNDDLSEQDAPYTNREIREKWHDTSNVLQRIEQKVDRTNGSVADLNRWRERVNGGMTVAGIAATIIVVPILGWAIYTLVNIKDTIHNSIVDTLQAYDITLK